MDRRIRELDGEKAYYLMCFEFNFGKKQRELLLEDLRAMDNESNEYAHLAYSFLNSVSSPYGGGIGFVFDERVLYLQDEALTKMLDELDEYVMSSNFMANIHWINSIENDLDDLIDSNDDLIQSYLDACSECAYTVNKEDLYDIFGEKFSKDEIEKVIVFNELKNSEIFSD